MRLGWAKSVHSPIGIDFGADSIKLLQLAATSPPQILAAAALTLPDEARADPTARHAFNLEAITTLLKSQKFKGRRAIVSIPSHYTLVQHLQLPPGGEADDLHAQIELHLLQRMNIDPSRLVIRHAYVGDVVRDGSTRQEVLCIAVARDVVMRHIEAAQRAKLEVVGMHSEPHAILRAFSHLNATTGDQKRTTCFVDIGAATTKVVISQNGRMVFAKNIHAAGDQITRHFATAKGILFSEARQMRLAMAESTGRAGEAAVVSAMASPATVGAAAESGESGGSGFAMIDAQMRAANSAEPTGNARTATNTAAAGDTLDCIIDEMRLCSRYYQSVFPDSPIQKLVFVGGESRHVDMCQKIARALRIGAQLGDPLARVVRMNLPQPPRGVDLNQPQPGWAVPMGLCLSEPNI